MKKATSVNHASNITNYQAVNCNGKELGIVEGLITVDKHKKTCVLLSTHHKDLFGNLKYAVPFDLCDIDHDNKTIWLNVDKNELEFLYKLTDLYDKNSSIWDDELDIYFNINNGRLSHAGNQNLKY